MFKLLTDEERKRVAAEYARRRAIVMLVGVIGVLVVGIIGILPSYLASTRKLSEAREHIETLRASQASSDLDPKAWLKDINTKLEALNPSRDKDRPSLVIDEVVGKRGTAISLNNFSWSIERNKQMMSVSGIAADRQTLIDFRDRLATSESLPNVALPISNLTKDQDINFQVELSSDSRSTTNTTQ